MSASKRPLLTPTKVSPGDGTYQNGAFFRDASSVSANDVALPKLLDQNGDVGEETVYEVQIVNENLSRKANRSQLASKSQFLTRRWQTALVASLTLLALAGGIGESISLCLSPLFSPSLLEQVVWRTGSLCRKSSPNPTFSTMLIVT